MDPAVGELIGRGRATDVYDIGGGRVLRRTRGGDPAHIEHEAMIMRHVGANGYRVPEVHDVDGTDIVMERLQGHTMLHALTSTPWRMRSLAFQLADLHLGLEHVPIGPLLHGGARQRFTGPDHPADCVLHLDLHPDNVMLTPDGPVVFDWTNACVGPRAADIANTWVLLTTSDIDAGNPAMRALARGLRRTFVERFLDRAGRMRPSRMLPVVAAARLEDRNLRPAEAERVRAMMTTS